MINNNTLEMLLIDSHLTNLASVTLPSTEVEFSTEHDDSPYSSAHLQSTFIPASARNFTEQETIEQSIIDQQATRHHINWRSVVLAYYILLTLGNSLDYITNILLMQSPAQHQKIMPCQVGQLQGRCFLRLAPQCFNICLVINSCCY